MILNQVGGDINPAEPVCEYLETRLGGVAVWEKVNLFQSSLVLSLKPDLYLSVRNILLSLAN